MNGALVTPLLLSLLAQTAGAPGVPTRTNADRTLGLGGAVGFYGGLAPSTEQQLSNSATCFGLHLEVFLAWRPTVRLELRPTLSFVHGSMLTTYAYHRSTFDLTAGLSARWWLTTRYGVGGSLAFGSRSFGSGPLTLVTLPFAGTSAGTAPAIQATLTPLVAVLTPSSSVALDLGAIAAWPLDANTSRRSLGSVVQAFARVTVSGSELPARPGEALLTRLYPGAALGLLGGTGTARRLTPDGSTGDRYWTPTSAAAVDAFVRIRLGARAELRPGVTAIFGARGDADSPWRGEPHFTLTAGSGARLQWGDRFSSGGGAGAGVLAYSDPATDDESSGDTARLPTFTGSAWLTPIAVALSPWFELSADVGTTLWVPQPAHRLMGGWLVWGRLSVGITRTSLRHD